MSRLRVGVVRGGPSSEYVVSLKTGENVLASLSRERYIPIDIMITPRGEWYMDGMRTDLANISHHIDVAWNAMHGAFGEDGKVQKLFEAFGIPYTGSGVLASAVAMHKDLAKDRFREAGLLVPRGAVVEAVANVDEAAAEVVDKLGLPLVIKPVSGGSSVATTVARTLEEVKNAITKAREYGDVLIEEYIEGKEATVPVVDAGVKGEHFILFPIEIVPPSSNSFFDFDAKYSGESQEICPGRFPLMTHVELRNLALKAHRAVGAEHYSRTDFILSPKGIYILELNTLPGLTAESLLPKALKAGGVTFPDFLDHVIELALARK